MDSPSSSLLDLVLIEDSSVLRNMLSAMLADIPNTRIIGSAASEAEGLALLQRIHPKMVIVDLELQEGTGLNLLAALKHQPERFGAPKPVVFSNHAHSVVQARCRMLGAVAFFDKSFQMDDLLDFVENAAGGRAIAVN